jgi:hypothetical protein
VSLESGDAGDVAESWNLSTGMSTDVVRKATLWVTELLSPVAAVFSRSERPNRPSTSCCAYLPCFVAGSTAASDTVEYRQSRSGVPCGRGRLLTSEILSCPLIWYDLFILSLPPFPFSFSSAPPSGFAVSGSLTGPSHVSFTRRLVHSCSNVNQDRLIPK